MNTPNVHAPLEAVFTEGLSRKQLRYQHCGHCGQAQSLARHACTHCGAQALQWRESCGRGLVRACSTVHRAPSESFRPLLPYTLVLVELAEGFRLMAHAAPGVRLGDRVQACFFAHKGRPLVRFIPFHPCQET